MIRRPDRARGPRLVAGRPQAKRRQLRQHLHEELESRLLLAADGLLDIPSFQAVQLAHTTEGWQPPPGRLREKPRRTNWVTAALRKDCAPPWRNLGAADLGRSIALTCQPAAVHGSAGRTSTPGNSASIDTLSIDQILRLGEQFNNLVAQPLNQFLDTFPQATPAQLIQQFSFLTPVGSLQSGLEGVRIQFNPQAKLPARYWRCWNRCSARMEAV